MSSRACCGSNKLNNNTLAASPPTNARNGRNFAMVVSRSHDGVRFSKASLFVENLVGICCDMRVTLTAAIEAITMRQFHDPYPNSGSAWPAPVFIRLLGDSRWPLRRYCAPTTRVVYPADAQLVSFRNPTRVNAKILAKIGNRTRKRKTNFCEKRQNSTLFRSKSPSF